MSTACAHFPQSSRVHSALRSLERRVTPAYLEVKMQNSATRIITRTSYISHITPVLQQLHWLPIENRIINRKAPPYIQGHQSSCSYVSHRAPPYQRTHPFSQSLFVHPAHPPTCTPGYHGVKSLRSLSPPTIGILCLVTSNTPLPLPLSNLT